MWRTVAFLFVAACGASATNGEMPDLAQSPGGDGGGDGGGSTADLASGPGPSVGVKPDGTFTVTFADPPWTFSGAVGSPMSNVGQSGGSDGIGSFQETGFDWNDGVPRHGAIRF